MFEDFRQQADNSQFEETPDQSAEEGVAEEEATTSTPLLPTHAKRILGMTAPQRLVIAVLLMFEVCLLGSMFLLVTSKIVPTLFY